MASPQTPVSNTPTTGRITQEKSELSSRRSYLEQYDAGASLQLGQKFEGRECLKEKSTHEITDEIGIHPDKQSQTMGPALSESKGRGRTIRTGMRQFNNPEAAGEKKEEEKDGFSIIGSKGYFLPRPNSFRRQRGRSHSLNPTIEKEIGDPDREESTEKARAEERRGMASFVKVGLERAADEKAYEQLRKNTVKVFEEMTKLRIELSLAEAAVEGGKKQHDAAVNELESELKHCQQELCILEAEARDNCSQRVRSMEDETRLREELKRTQEALSFLSAWDEEKVVLDIEVASLKKKLAEAMNKGDNELREAQRAFDISKAEDGLKAQARLTRDTDKVRLELERGLGEDFRSRMLENDLLRGEKEHQSYQMNQMVKDLTALKADQTLERAQLEDERRMHLTTIRKMKRAEAAIAELQAQLFVISTQPGPHPPYQNNHSLRLVGRPGATTTKNTWRITRPSSNPSHSTGRAKSLIRSQGNKGGPDRAGGSGTRGDTGKGDSNDYQGIDLMSQVSQKCCKPNSSSIFPGLLVPVRSPSNSEDTNTFLCQENCSESVAGETIAAGGLDPSSGGRKRRRKSSKGNFVGIENCDSDSRNDNVGRRGHSGGPGASSGNEGGGKDNDTPKLIASGISDAMSTDVWGLLDNRVHRRSGIAQANRHLLAIEVMRENLVKSAEHADNATGASNKTTHMSDEGRVDGDDSTTDEDVLWRISRKKWGRRRSKAEGRETRRFSEVPKFTSYAKGQSSLRGPGNGHSKTSTTTPIRSPMCLEPHPPCGRRNGQPSNGSISSLSKNPGVRVWKGSKEEYYSPEMRCMDGFREDGVNRNERGQLLSKGEGRPRTINQDHGEKSRDKTPPPLSTPQDDRHASSEDDGCYVGNSAFPSADLRWPSPAISTALRTVGTSGTARAATAVKVVAGVLWGEKRTKATQQRGRRHTMLDRSGKLPPHSKKGSKARGGNRGPGVGWKRRTCREIELADWIEANTNLVNVFPWQKGPKYRTVLTKFLV